MQSEIKYERNLDVISKWLLAHAKSVHKFVGGDVTRMKQMLRGSYPTNSELVGSFESLFTDMVNRKEITDPKLIAARPKLEA